jgi:hypothetical protein
MLRIKDSRRELQVAFAKYSGGLRNFQPVDILPGYMRSFNSRKLCGQPSVSTSDFKNSQRLLFFAKITHQALRRLLSDLPLRIMFMRIVNIRQARQLLVRINPAFLSPDGQVQLLKNLVRDLGGQRSFVIRMCIHCVRLKTLNFRLSVPPNFL